MSQEIKDVCVCFRPPLEVSEVVLVTHRLLEQFPLRVPPEFRPWFPSVSDGPPPLRPLRPPPVIRPQEEERTPQRSWCVMGGRGVRLRGPRSLSGPFQQSVERLGLDPRQRVRWVLDERHCGTGRLELLWLDIGRSIRRALLPSCNAHFQRALAQIWLYCDVRYCQDIGHFLKQELRLSGRITLTAHRLGHILHF